MSICPAIPSHANNDARARYETSSKYVCLPGSIALSFVLTPVAKNNVDIGRESDMFMCTLHEFPEVSRSLTTKQIAVGCELSALGRAFGQTGIALRAE